jgi:flagellar biosynthesis/type III secretory pathway chaperone
MSRSLEELERIIQEEINLFEEVYMLELKKSDAVINQDGGLLESISLDQEGMISRISYLESERNKQVLKIANNGNQEDNLTLSNVVEFIGRESSDQIVNLGRELKGTLKRLSELRRTNDRMMQNNMEFYQAILAGLKKGSGKDSGYGSDGKEEERTGGSLLFNKKA